MQLISATILHQELNNNSSYEIIDVRESYEYEICNIGSKHIPMAEVCLRLNEFSENKNIVIMCRTGKRAEAIANLLEKEYHMTNVFILAGGILSWKEEVNNNLICE